MKNVTKSLKDLLVGILLGDGHIRRVGVNKAYFTFEQSAQKADYFNHVYNSVSAENLVREAPVFYTRSDSRYQGKITSSWYFKSNTIEDLRPFAELFLDESGNKRVPLNISDLLTPRSLAFWIMDDGQQVKKGGVTLCTDSFKHEEIVRLQDVLKSNFDLKTTIHSKKGVNVFYERIYISKDSAYENLKSSIADHMQESMLYKINMAPFTDSSLETPSGSLTPTVLSEEAINQVTEESTVGVSTLESVDKILQDISDITNNIGDL